MKSMTRKNRKNGTLVVSLVLALLVQVLSLFGSAAVSHADWVWSMRLAINDLKFYPDQIFPVLTYPVDYDEVSLPDPVNDLSIQVPQGSEVIWVNRDRDPSNEPDEVTIIPHMIQVKGPDEKVIGQSPLLVKWQESFAVKFEQAGDYSYRCLLHPQKMQGKIKVSPWGLELVNRK